MEKVKHYKQTRNVPWLSAPAGTIWYNIFDDNIQPVDSALWETPFGVDLSLLMGTDDEDLFVEIPKNEL